ncbi:MAG: hypothetical protein K2G15_01220 [Muribaculaceae bacterium]|nr:hypothetical protein [Muribaculaceae bacterium]
MSKLIIPAAELIGTPLTPEELKGIIAGAVMEGHCSCDWILTNYTSYTAVIGTVADETECSEKCKAKCNSNDTYKCATYKWHYAGSGTGTGN